MQGEAAALAHQGVLWAIFFFTNDSLLYWGQDKMSLQLTSRCVELTSTCLRVSSDYQIEFKFKLQSIVSKWMFKNFLILTFEWRTKKKDMKKVEKFIEWKQQTVLWEFKLYLLR